MRKSIAHLAKSSPQFTSHAVCDVIIGDGIWLLRVNIMPAWARPPGMPLGKLGGWLWVAS